MALLDDVKVAVRVSEGTEDFDSELEMLIQGAFAELERVGIKPSLLDEDEPAPLVKHAVILYAKAHFGYDNSERQEFASAFKMIETDLLNSSANMADSGE